jgi:hypothetical protein
MFGVMEGVFDVMGDHDALELCGAEFLAEAERELAAFCGAVLKMHGADEAERAAQDWLDALKRISWIGDGAPDWRRVTIFAAQCVALRVMQTSPCW